jgi:hypothetical protein
MSQIRYKGIECEQCGRPSNVGLRLRFSVIPRCVTFPKGKHPIYDIDMYGDFCSKECIFSFIKKHYFDTEWEVEE